jgi:hypothetical protein
MSGAVTTLDDMRQGRNNPGIVRAGDVVFVFGGWLQGQRFKSGEKFSLQTYKWTSFQHDMESERHQFNPTIHEQTIYLAGGYESTVIETFSVSEERFATLPITLPDERATLCLVTNGELVIMQGRTLFRWHIKAKKMLETKTLSMDLIDSDVSPILVGSMVYFSNVYAFETKIIALDLGNMSLIQIHTIEHTS